MAYELLVIVVKWNKKFIIKLRLLVVVPLFNTNTNNINTTTVTTITTMPKGMKVKLSRNLRGKVN